MGKNKLFLILSGLAAAAVGMLYLHFFGFEKSLFRVDVPRWSVPPSRRQRMEISRAEFMNDVLSLIDWVILIGIVIIVILIFVKTIKALVVSLFRGKRPSQK
ncbi:MAG: hypothetical protein OXI67_18995 [Candidatus Poribacteria bacterium]|nr:hypothetical protein [Candidatus Poribacteria bacterium]